MQKFKNYINGEFTESKSGKSFKSIDPSSEKEFAEISLAEEYEVNSAVEAAHNAFYGEWSKILPSKRANYLRAIGDQLKEKAELLGTIETKDTGKLFKETKFQANYIAEYYYYYAGLVDKIEGSTLPIDKEDMHVFTTRVPVGVVAAIIPWNSQMFLTAVKLAPALAMGNTIIIKASEIAPTPLLEFAKIIDKVGIPKGVVNIITGFADTCSKLLTSHPKINKIAFTGGVHTAKHIVRNSAENLSQISLELGGKSPVVVFPDADLEKVIPGAARACFFLQGQNCMAGTRLFVHKDIYEPVLAGVKEMAEAFTIGHGLIPTNDFGPLISATQKERVMEYIQIGKDEGADLVSGGESVGDRGYFVQPTIFSNVKGDMRIAREEIFGPVLCAESFDDSDLETIANKANNTSYGLSGSVWTQDISVAHKMAMLIDSGQVSINCHAAVDPAIPFGGNKQSGWGREFGKEGLEPYLKTKATTVIF